MIETPSIIFTEIDESELKEDRNGTEWLVNKNGENELHSFIQDNRLLTAYPCIEPNKFYTFQLQGIQEWSASSIEHTAALQYDELSIRAFCKNIWDVKAKCELGEKQLGLSGLVYRIAPSDHHSSHLQNVEGRNDDDTSCIFNGVTLKNIEKAESFYHLGWYADMEFKGIKIPPVRVWIHKKNIDSPPEEGHVYQGEMWLQAKLAP